MTFKPIKSMALAVTLIAVAQLGVARTVDRTIEFHAVTVSYADLNVHSVAGAKALLQRIRVATAGACRPDPDDLRSDQPPNIACESNATKRAVLALANPLVTALYEGRRGDDAAQMAGREP